MEPETARTLRQTLQHLMKDCDRRQELVQELIITNNSLRYKSLRILSYEPEADTDEQRACSGKWILL